MWKFRFLEPPSETKTDLKNRIDRQIGGKITLFDRRRGKQLKARVIRRFEKSRVGKIEISLNSIFSYVFVCAAYLIAQSYRLKQFSSSKVITNPRFVCCGFTIFLIKDIVKNFAIKRTRS